MIAKLTKKVNIYDKSHMRQVILDFPRQFKVGFEAAKNIKVSSFKFQVSSLIVCGMGGSALPGELLKLVNANYFHSPISIHIHRTYGLPSYIENWKLSRLLRDPAVAGKIENSLIVCISYSGNTEETISSYQEAIKRKLPIVSIASGGKLAELSKKYKTLIAIIPSGIQPRCALGYQFSALIKILGNLRLIKNIDREILEAAENFNPAKLENQGKNLAKKLLKKIPLIYASQSYKALAYIWKIKFNENSKIPAFWNYFPELNHNEMVGFEKFQIPKSKFQTKSKIQNPNSKLFSIFIMRDNNEYPRILKRMRLTAELLRKNGIMVDFIDIQGKNIWEKVFNNLILGDWVSYWLAIYRGIDPTPVEMVEKFKRKLAK